MSLRKKNYSKVVCLISIVIFCMFIDYIYATDIPNQIKNNEMMFLGSGTKNNPYLIECEENLIYLSQHDELWNDNLFFKQTNNLDLQLIFNSDNNFIYQPIGSQSNPFVGDYDGNCHTISNLYIAEVHGSRKAIFGSIEDSNIYDLGVENFEIHAYDYLAGLAGDCYNSTIERCYAKGVIRLLGDDSGRYVWFAASLIGGVKESFVKDCHGEVDIKNGAGKIGTLFGSVSYNTQVVNCYGIGELEHSYYSLGLTGYFGSNSQIENSYYRLEGANTTSNYAAECKSNFELKHFDCYSNWSMSHCSTGDNEYVWKFADYNYPRLSWEECQFIHIPDEANTSFLPPETTLYDIDEYQNCPNIDNSLVVDFSVTLTNYEHVTNSGHFYIKGKTLLEISKEDIKGEIIVYVNNNKYQNYQVISNCILLYLDEENYRGEVDIVIVERGDSGLPLLLNNFEVKNDVTTKLQANIQWNTFAENNMQGFNIYRANTADFETTTKINEQLILAQNSPLGCSYQFYDSNIEYDHDYYYSLKAVLLNSQEISTSSFHYHSPKNLLNDNVSLLNNDVRIYPNPFNSETIITFTTKDVDYINLEIYNIRGQKVRDLLKQEVEIGAHRVVWNGKNNSNRSVASGIYYAILKSNKEKNKSIKMTLMK